MDKREHMVSIRYTDEEFAALNTEYQRQLRGVLTGTVFTLSSMIRIKTLRPDNAQGKQRMTSHDGRKTA